MSNKIFNPNKKYFDILNLIGYISSKDIFVRKLKTEILKNFNFTTSSVSFHLTLQSGHLRNRKIKKDFIEIVKIIIEESTISLENKNRIIEKVVIAADNSSKSLSIVFEINDLTTTVTIVSTVLDAAMQPSTHLRKNFHETIYVPGNMSFFHDDDTVLYGIAGRNKLLDKINEAKSLNAVDRAEVVSFVVPLPKYSDYSEELYNYLKSEAVTNVLSLIGINPREDISYNFHKNTVTVYKDRNGFFVELA